MAIDLQADIIEEMTKQFRGTQPRLRPSVNDWLDEPVTFVTELHRHEQPKIVEFPRHLRPTRLEAEFSDLVRQWRRETALSSLTSKKILHRAYLRIIGMGPAVIPLILRELKEHSGHWSWALYALTGEDPAESASSYNEERLAWLNWGKEHGYIS